MDISDLTGQLPTEQWEAEQKLLLAVLKRSIQDLEEWIEDPCATNLARAVDSYMWLMSRETGIRRRHRVAKIRSKDEFLEIFRTRQSPVSLSRGRKQFLIGWEALGVTFDYLCRALGLDPFLLQVRLGEKIRGLFFDRTRGRDPEQLRKWDAGREKIFWIEHAVSTQSPESP